MKYYKIPKAISYIANFVKHVVSDTQSQCNYAAKAVNEILQNFLAFSYLLDQQQAASSKLKAFS